MANGGVGQTRGKMFFNSNLLEEGWIRMSLDTDRLPDCLGSWQLARLITRCSGTDVSRRVRRIIFAALKDEIKCVGCNLPLGVGGETCFCLHPQNKTALVYHLVCANGYTKLRLNDPSIARWVTELNLKLPPVADAPRHKKRREKMIKKRCYVYRQAGR